MRRIALLVSLLASCVDERPARFEVGACGYTWMINGTTFSSECAKGCDSGPVTPLVSVATADACTCAPAYFAESADMTGCCIPEEVDGEKQWTWKDCE